MVALQTQRLTKTSLFAFAALPYAKRIAECERPQPERQYLRDTFGQGCWGRRERFIGWNGWPRWAKQRGCTSGAE